MKSKRSLMTVLVGLAMLAAPITAAAYDNNHRAHSDSHAAHVSRSFNAPTRSFAPTHNNVAPAVTRREFHNNAVAAKRDWRANRTWADANAYRNNGRNYGNHGYYPAPVYTAPGYMVPGYGAGYGGGQNCARAQRIVNNYYRDRNSGHPAAAYDLLAQNRWAFRSGCAGAAPYGGGGLFGGAPAYNNYGGYGQPYGGYNGGYGQSYGSGSTLAPLIQQFVR